MVEKRAAKLERALALKLKCFFFWNGQGFRGVNSFDSFVILLSTNYARLKCVVDIFYCNSNHSKLDGNILYNNQCISRLYVFDK